MNARILLAGGGTGGHVFPLVALAEVLSVIAPSIEVRFVGTETGLEARVVRERGWTLDTLPMEPLQGRSILGKLRGGAMAAAATARATGLVTSHRPKLVVSIGGYAAGPVSLAAAALGIPVVLLEPNRTAGLTQRLLVPLAKRIYVGFPEALSAAGEKGRAFGIPLRKGFSRFPLAVRAADEPIHILIMGGSQGAEHLNQTMPAVIARLARGASIRVVHQAGRDRAGDVRQRYGRAFDSAAASAIDRGNVADDATRLEDEMERARRKGPKEPPVEIVEFIADVPARLQQADVVVARSGALTCAELCAVGRPSILIPYPHAADDHQAANAEALQAVGAAIAIRQEQATVEAVNDAMRSLVIDPAFRARMAAAAANRGMPDAAENIARDMLALVRLEAA